MGNSYPLKMNGYIYSRGTKAGFNRMKRLGIPRPLFRLEDKLAKVLKKHYKNLIKKLLKEIKKTAATNGVTLDHSLTLDGDDSLDDLLKFFEEMAQETIEQTELQKKIADRANMGSVANTLEQAWFEGGGSPTESDIENAEELRTEINGALQEEQSEYLGRLFTDADGKTQAILQAFSIDKQKLFDDNMKQLRALYLDNSLERIAWEQNYIKREMLKRILQYANGESDTLELDDLTKLAYLRGDHIARLFARDQMQRFNKAVTLSTFINAGVTKIKWVTTHDVRVRKTHRELDGKVFDINNLPNEIDDYNCRCGLVPVEWAE